MRRFAIPLVLALGTPAAPAAGGEITGAQLVLDVAPEGTPGRYPEAAPPRFVLLDKGVVYAGGSSEIAAGRLDSTEVKAIEARIERIRKLPGLGSSVTLGPGSVRYRLQLLGKRPLEIVASGEPATAPAALQPLASLLADLEAFDHPSLRFVQPESYWLVAREGPLAGGCRAWSFDVPVAEAAAGRTVSAAAAADWPKGALAASACAGGKRYVVTLRPLLPGERP